MGLVCFPTFSVVKTRLYYYKVTTQSTIYILAHTQTVDFLSNNGEKKMTIFLFPRQNG